MFPHSLPNPFVFPLVIIVSLICRVSTFNIPGSSTTLGILWVYLLQWNSPQKFFVSVGFHWDGVVWEESGTWFGLVCRVGGSCLASHSDLDPLIYLIDPLVYFIYVYTVVGSENGSRSREQEVDHLSNSRVMPRPSYKVVDDEVMFNKSMRCRILKSVVTTISKLNKVSFLSSLWIYCILWQHC